MNDAANRDAVRAFLGRLLDDAGLFPPAQLSLDDALAAHERAANGPFAWLLGRFVAPVSRLGDLAAACKDRATPLRVTAVVDGAPGDAYATLAATLAEPPAGFALEALEVKLADLPGDEPAAKMTALREIEAGAGRAATLPVYVEIALGDDAHLELNLQALTERIPGPRRFAKVRCGGKDSNAVPPPAQLAQFIARTRDCGLAFKATAGLHHAFYGPDPAAGYARHGFVNVAAAALLSRTHSFDRAKLEALLCDESAADFRLTERAFAWRGAAVTPAEIVAARRAGMHAFGSCSFDEPADELAALGISS